MTSIRRGAAATRAKQVTAVTVAMTAAGAWYGVSRDGRGAEAAVVIEPPPATASTATTVPRSVTTSPATSFAPATSEAVTTTLADIVPTSRLRTRGSR